MSLLRDGAGVPSGATATRSPSPEAYRRRPRAITALVLLLVLSACARPELTDPIDALPLDEPPTPAPPVGREHLPPVIDGSTGWATPYASDPKGSDTGFVGPVTPEGSGELHFVGVGADGRTRWSTERNPSCTGFTLTRTTRGEDLVVLLDSDAAPDRGLLATRTTAAAFDPDTGHKVWGPTDVPGTWVGPGLVFAQIAHTVMNADTGPAVALSADTGAVVADERQGDTVLHEYHGTVVLHRDGGLRAIDSLSDEELWRGADLPLPDTLDEGGQGTTLAYGPRPVSDSAPLTVLTWERGGSTVFTVHDLRNGRSLGEFSAQTEPVSIGDDHGRAVVAGVSARSGESVMVGWDGGSGDEVWSVEAAPGERPVRIVSGYLYTSLGEENRVRSMSDGELLGSGRWEIPVAGTAGEAVTMTLSGDADDSYVVFAAHGADQERQGT
ncbi:pyrrolo-quinoline quinone [Nocardiopsis sp. ATB16-24]|uniref:pyrrolo-quinoline quinone n=1 Tax=Nocardiopsis sp. ATB16-24 TaxID=3019555 RepID=UPI002555D223|nr:pyrrolo-quinoline quinone [Nocardiopsis sp. ATB16-24]